MLSFKRLIDVRFINTFRDCKSFHLLSMVSHRFFLMDTVKRAGKVWQPPFSTHKQIYDEFVQKIIKV